MLPSIDQFTRTFLRLRKENEGIIKSGRTHLQNAAPVQFSREVSGWGSMLEKDKEIAVSSLIGSRGLVLGDTAIGTGLNVPKGFNMAAIATVPEPTGINFGATNNKLHPLASKDMIVFTHSALRALAANMMRVASDVRWLSSGPRCGLGEIQISGNEPSSLIVSGEAGPTQCESVTMIAVQVTDNDCAIGFVASQGSLELNVFIPVITHNLLQPVRPLPDSLRSFELHCARGVKADRRKMNGSLSRSLMLVIALTPYIGYDHAAQTTKEAYKEDVSLRGACISLGFLTGEEPDRVLHPE